MLSKFSIRVSLNNSSTLETLSESHQRILVALRRVLDSRANYLFIFFFLVFNVCVFFGESLFHSSVSLAVLGACCVVARRRIQHQLMARQAATLTASPSATCWHPFFETSWQPSSVKQLTQQLCAKLLLGK